MFKKFKSNYYEIDAIQYNGYNENDIKNFVGEDYIEITYLYAPMKELENTNVRIILKTMKGRILLHTNDYVIKHLNETNGFYTLSNEDFNLMYSKID